MEMLGTETDENHGSVRIAFWSNVFWVCSRSLFLLFVLLLAYVVKEPLDAFLRRMTATATATDLVRQERLAALQEAAGLRNRALYAQERADDLLMLAGQVTRAPSDKVKRDFERRRKSAELALDDLRQALQNRKTELSPELRALLHQLLAETEDGQYEAGLAWEDVLSGRDDNRRSFGATRYHLLGRYREVQYRVMMERRGSSVTSDR
jgi:hypothetical protein